MTTAAGWTARVSVGPDPVPATQDREARVFALLNAAQHPYAAKAALWRIAAAERPVAQRLAELQATDVTAPLLAALTELLTAV